MKLSLVAFPYYVKHTIFKNSVNITRNIIPILKCILNYSNC